ncbi:MAG: polyphosphate kinase 2 family protein [Lachnospiraceae bacterium]|nr:polyphosphate kinase 2 family protein [Lachnospiraceae bacterium]
MGIEIGKLKFDGSRKFDMKGFDTADNLGVDGKQKGQELLEEYRPQLVEWQSKLYADGGRSLLIIFQAMDAAGKDGMINHVFSGVNPQGVQVTSFKQPSKPELAHDYLWRIHQAVPPKGMIGIFNRSHYEDVLVGKVLDLPKAYGLPGAGKAKFWDMRYRQISDFERMLTENGTAVLKFFLHVSKEEQRKRLLSRLDDKSKNWKFETGDLTTREDWDAYMKAYKDAINRTATPFAPWYVIPADKKWAARLAVAKILLDTFEDMKPKYPEIGKAGRKQLEECRSALQPGKGEGKAKETPKDTQPTKVEGKGKETPKDTQPAEAGGKDPGKATDVTATSGSQTSAGA